MIKKTGKLSKIISIYTIYIYILAIISFEMGYCNTNWVRNIINGNEYSYNFSTCRIIIYILFIILYIIFRKPFIKEAIETLDKKTKKIFFLFSILAIILSIALEVFIILNNIILLRGTTIGLIAVLMGSLFILYVSNNPIKNIVIVICTFGLVFTITTFFNHHLDEKKHFITAFNIANLNFDYAGENAITDKNIEELPQITKFVHEKVDKLLEGKYSEEIIKVNVEDVPSAPTPYLFTLYIFSAIGIWLAKILGGSIIDMYILGRIFNLVIYGILISLAIKTIPFKKNILFVVAFMPMALLLAASYSIDGICIGLVFLFIAYCMKIYKESEVITLKQTLLLIGLFLLLLTAKSMSYILVGMIALILPIIKTLKKNKKYLPLILGITAILIIFTIVGLIYVKNEKMVADTRGGNTNTSEQMQIMLQNPKHDVQLAINQIEDTLVNFDWYSNLHPSIFFGETSRYMIFIMLFFIFYVSITEDDYNFKIKDKIILIISYLSVFAITSVILYITFTEIGELHVAGYQTRYILPILPLFLFCISNKKVKILNSENRTMNIAIYSAIFLFAGILQAIIV